MTQAHSAQSGTARLAAVAELVRIATRVADIGADHGRLACSLLESKRSPHCIATDRDELALAALRRLAALRFPTGNLEIRGGDGCSRIHRIYST